MTFGQIATISAIFIVFYFTLNSPSALIPRGVSRNENRFIYLVYWFCFYIKLRFLDMNFFQTSLYHWNWFQLNILSLKKSISFFMAHESLARPIWLSHCAKSLLTLIPIKRYWTIKPRWKWGHPYWGEIWGQQLHQEWNSARMMWW